MNETPIEETQPAEVTPPADETQPFELKSQPKKRTALWVIGIILGFLLITVIGGLLGYASGISDRKAAEKNSILLAASQQFQLAELDLQAGNYDFAQQRYEYVLQLDPTFPGLMEKMAALKIIMSATVTPTTPPEATVAPTLDTSGEDGLLNQVKQLLVNQDFEGTILALDTLRKTNPTYKVLELDGLYYHTYLARGVNKIYQQGELEGGIFDFAQAKLYGPLTREARDAKEWAELYISAAGYWIVDWPKTIQYLNQIYPHIPGLMDNSKYTVAERLRLAYYLYGSKLFDDKDYCEAKEQLQASLSIGDNQKTAELFQKANNKCNHAPEITTGGGLPDGQVTIPYAIQFTASDADSDALTWSLIGGALPDGLSLASDGSVSGAPGTAGSFSFTVSVSDGRGGEASREFTINVIP
jgi:tetratricopeptide (TPR) repeat protein